MLGMMVGIQTKRKRKEKEERERERGKRKRKEERGRRKQYSLDWICFPFTMGGVEM